MLKPFQRVEMDRKGRRRYISRSATEDLSANTTASLPRHTKLSLDDDKRTTNDDKNGNRVDRTKEGSSFDTGVSNYVPRSSTYDNMSKYSATSSRYDIRNSGSSSTGRSLIDNSPSRSRTTDYSSSPYSSRSVDNAKKDSYSSSYSPRRSNRYDDSSPRSHYLDDKSRYSSSSQYVPSTPSPLSTRKYSETSVLSPSNYGITSSPLRKYSDYSSNRYAASPSSASRSALDSTSSRSYSPRDRRDYLSNSRKYQSEDVATSRRVPLQRSRNLDEGEQIHSPRDRNRTAKSRYEVESKSESPRARKCSSRAQTTDITSLRAIRDNIKKDLETLKADEEKKEVEKENVHLNGDNLPQSKDARAERIRKYKEDRRRELASKSADKYGERGKISDNSNSESPSYRSSPVSRVRSPPPRKDDLQQLDLVSIENDAQTETVIDRSLISPQSSSSKRSSRRSSLLDDTDKLSPHSSPRGSIASPAGKILSPSAVTTSPKQSDDGPVQKLFEGLGKPVADDIEPRNDDTRRDSSSSVSSSSKSSSRRRYITRERDPNNLTYQERRKTADDIAADLVALEENIQTRADTRKKAQLRKSTLNQSTEESEQILVTDTKSPKASDSGRQRKRSPFTKTTPVTTDEYKSAVAESNQSQDEIVESDARVDKMSHVVEAIDDEASESSSVLKDGKHIKKYSQLVSPETTSVLSDSPRRLHLSPGRDVDIITPVQASPVQASYMSVKPSVPVTNEPTRFKTHQDSKTKSSPTKIKEDLSPVTLRRTVSLKEHSPELKKIEPDEELQKILSRRSRDIEEYMSIGKTKVDKYTPVKPKESKDCIEKVIADEELVLALKNRRMRSESDEREPVDYTVPEVSEKLIEPASILRIHGCEKGESSTDPPSILRNKVEAETKPLSVSILKRKSVDEDAIEKKVSMVNESNDGVNDTQVSPVKSHHSSGEDRKTILKKRDNVEITEPVSILKKRDSIDTDERITPPRSRRSSGEDVRSILKKPDSIDTDDIVSPSRSRRGSEEGRSILKRRDSDGFVSPSHSEERRVSILKKKSVDETADVVSILKNRPRESECDVSRSILKKSHCDMDSETKLSLSSVAPCSVPVIPRRSSCNVEVSSQMTHTTLDTDDRGENTLVAGKRSPRKYQRSNTTGTFLDPELAKVFHQRRGDKELSPEEIAEQKLTAAEEIAIVRELELKEHYGSSTDDDRNISVAERIFQMQTYAEDETPSATKSETDSPTLNKMRMEARRFSEENPHISDAELLSRLADIADEKKRAKLLRDSWRRKTQPVTSAEIEAADSLLTVSEFRELVKSHSKRNIFAELQKQETDIKSEFPRNLSVKSRKRKDRKSPRYQTQPITLKELELIPETDSIKLEIVARTPEQSRIQREDNRAMTPGTPDLNSMLTRSFSKTDMTEVDQEFEKLFDWTIQEDITAKEEWDEQIIYEKKDVIEAKRKREKKRKASLKTQMMETNDSLRRINYEKDEEVRKTKEEDEKHSDEVTKLSVLEKASLFLQMEKRKREEEAGPPPRRLGAKRVITKSKRSFTQPITFEEVTNVSNKSDRADGARRTSLVEDARNIVMDDMAKDVAEDEASKLSLKEKMKMFSSLDEDKDKPLPKRDAPVIRRRLRRNPSRFNTQPITYDEVEKAAKISPLAMTLVKPPDPELMGGLSISAQRELMVGYAEKILSQPSSRFGSRRDSISDLEEEDEDDDVKEKQPSDPSSKGTLDLNKLSSKLSQMESKNDDVDGRGGTNSRSNPAIEPGVRSILKREGSFERAKAVSVMKRRNVKDDTTSDEDDESDKASSSKCKNEAIARRRVHRDKERYQSQPVGVTTTSSVDEKKTPPSSAKKMTTRHMTQPITPEEKKRANNDTENLSIQERLALLKKSGENDWKQRVDPDVATVTPRTGQRQRGERPKSITSLVTQLTDSSEKWKGRVEDKDMAQFTVEGKMTMAGKISDSPLLTKKARTPRPASVHGSIVGRKGPLKATVDFRPKAESESSDSPSPPRSPTRGPPMLKFVRDETQPKTFAPVKNIVLEKESIEDESEEKKVQIPNMDDECMKSFFTTAENVKPEKVEVDDDAFNDLFCIAEDFLTPTRKIKPKRTRGATTRNPLRQLQNRDDIQQTYTSLRTDVAQRELKRVNKEKVALGASLAESALAGLASSENFSAISLRKVTSNTAIPGKTIGSLNLEPFKDVMLIHIKGRSRVQTRLVEPKGYSLNSGDCFVLVTPDAVFNWIGEYSNVIEKVKSKEVATTISEKKDLGYRSGKPLIEVFEKKQDKFPNFWEALGGKTKYAETGPPEEDTLYEEMITETNMVYKVEDEELVPYEQYWGRSLKHDMLDSKEVFVFDFGSELYSWQGRLCSQDSKRVVIKLAKILREQDYDYSETEINPISPLKDDYEDGGLVAKGSRPDWVLFGKINEKMETVLFREKFLDWPDTSKIIKVKTAEDSENVKLATSEELKPCNVADIIPLPMNPVNLKLEGSNLGRGRTWAENIDGLKREFDITTVKITCWHVMEFDHYQMVEKSYGQFHDCDTYVVRWIYLVTAAGLKSLKGHAARASVTGRNRCAYFFWQGRFSTVNEKGASALMTVELDEERGPQVRVEQGKEPACFTNLFNGSMIVHIGKREDESTNTQGDWRLYLLCNEIDTEAYLLEVPCVMESLRSRSSMVALNVNTGICLLWHGCKSPENTRTIARNICKNFQQKDNPVELSLHSDVTIVITELLEGYEDSIFWSAMQVDGSEFDRKEKYDCLLHDDSHSYDHTLRLFYMTSVAGRFEAQEILNPSRSEQCSPFPFIQDNLYKASQPALFMLDNNHEVFMWQGWWPEGEEEGENVKTGSATARFNIDRRCAIETIIEYCKAKNPDNPVKAYLVYGGAEPLHVTNCFPSWEYDDIAILQSGKDGRKQGHKVLLSRVLQKMSCNRYSQHELQDPNDLPEGVDPGKLESYLPDDEFQDLFEMTRSEFYSLPLWKQTNVKKEAGMF